LLCNNIAVTNLSGSPGFNAQSCEINKSDLRHSSFDKFEMVEQGF